MNIRPHPSQPKTFVVKFWLDKRHYKRTIPATSQKEAEKFAWLWRAKIAEGKWKPKAERPGDLTMREATGKFISDYSQPRKKSWKNDLTYARRINKFFGRMKLGDITPLKVEQFRTWLGATEFAGKRIKAIGVNRHHQFGKATFNRMRAWRLYSGENPFSMVKLEDETKYWRRRYLSQEEYRKLLDVSHPALVPILIVGAHTGLRPIEMRTLTKGQVNLDRCAISLPDPKSGKAEWLPFNETVFRTLEPLIKRLESPNDRILDFTNFARRWKKARQLADIKDCRFYDAGRHTAASWTAMTSGSLAAAQELLRHRDPKMTQRYAHLAPGYLRQVVAGLDNALSSSASPSDDQMRQHPDDGARFGRPDSDAGTAAAIQGQHQGGTVHEAKRTTQ